MTDLSLESSLVDEDSTPGPGPGDESGESGARGGSDDGTDGRDAPSGRHRPRRRDQWSMRGTTPPRRLLARLRDLLLGRASLRPAGART
jgi:hypothetical protein